ncbi:MAG: ribose 5-phosphate isomerase B [Candidatus Eisenbacteria bacterium]|nr:ribose 5-phosphate isomerase B [Candidatus Eisenbacteria bacterium]
MTSEKEVGGRTSTKIALGSDHAGFELKNHLVKTLRNEGRDVEDFGTFSLESVDYPDYGLRVAAAVADGRFQRGILVCHSGIGMSIAANKVRGVRAALCRDAESAKLSRLHNDSNVLVLGAGFTQPGEAAELVRIWLDTPFEGGRHARRVEKISRFEEKIDGPSSPDGGPRPVFWSYHGQTVKHVDAEVYGLLQRETKRHSETLDLVASESVVDPAILEAMGSIFALKYAEGYPGDRLYPGCEVMDEAETLAIERAKLLFGADHVNVQPYSGTQSNMATYFAILKPGDKIVSMRSDHGGHSTHGGKSSFSGALYRSFRYGVKKTTELIDYEQVEELAKKEKPRLIIAGGSAYSRLIDFARFRAIADSCDAMLMVDMAHLAGLVAAGIHPSPIPFADVVTSTTHKTLRGPRGGLILCRRELAEAIDRAVFPIMQGGPLMHVILAKAICFGLALQKEFREFQLQVVRNSRALAEEMKKLSYRIVSDGTDNHLFVVDTTASGIDGSVAWKELEKAGILVNKCAVPFEETDAFGGLRMGTLSLTSRGMKEADMAEVAGLIDVGLKKGSSGAEIAGVRAGVKQLCGRFKVYR